jgi:hypothetical protein
LSRRRVSVEPMRTVLGEILPLLIVVAVSPVNIVASILLLFSKRPIANASSYLVGFLLGVAAVLSGFTVLADAIGLEPDSDRSRGASALLLTLGAGLHRLGPQRCDGSGRERGPIRSSSRALWGAVTRDVRVSDPPITAPGADSDTWHPDQVGPDRSIRDNVGTTDVRSRQPTHRSARAPRRGSLTHRDEGARRWAERVRLPDSLTRPGLQSQASLDFG